MSWLISSCDRKSAARTVSATAVLLFALCIPQVSHGDAISQLESASHGKIDRPANGNAALINIQRIECPSCKGLITYYNGMRPTVCPYCGYSFIHPAGSPATGKSNNAAANSRAVQAIGNAYTNTLNSVKTDSATVAQQYKRFNESVTTQETGFDKERKELFSIHTSAGPMVSYSGLSNSAAFTPPKTRELGPLAGLTDDQLNQRYAQDEAEIKKWTLAQQRSLDNTARRRKVEADIQANMAETSTNWEAAKKRAAVDAAFAVGGGVLSAAGKSVEKPVAKAVLETTAKGVDYTDKTRSLAGDAKDVWDSTPHGTEETPRVQSSDTFDIVNPNSTYKSGGLASPEPYHLTVDPNFKNSVTLNEFSNVNFTAVDNPASKNGISAAEWKQAAASVRTTQPQLTIGLAAPADNGESFDKQKFSMALADAGITLVAGPEAGLGYSAGKFAIDAGDTYARNAIDDRLMDQSFKNDIFNDEDAEWTTDRIQKLKEDEQNIRAEQARRTALRNEQ